mmetsp:Transcript_48962/g.156771  ORF Transcript_48962/g.156771 Transcript_48962/m.156771 type:complete len:108 (-) Transcript_48962:6-329(-)
MPIEGSQGHVPLCAVTHQKLSVTVDVARNRISGYVELKVTAPNVSVHPTVGIHAHGLHIKSVKVNGTKVEHLVRKTKELAFLPQSSLKLLERQMEDDSKIQGLTDLM